LKEGRTGLAAIQLRFVHQKASPFRADRMMRQKEGENGELREVIEALSVALMLFILDGAGASFNKQALLGRQGRKNAIEG
jgi:hypothetical protein